MSIRILAIGVCILALRTVCFAENMTQPLVVTSYDVLTNSVRLGDGETNVYVSFRFEHKTPAEISEIIRKHVTKDVVIVDGAVTVARGKVEGALAQSNGELTGLVISFENRAQAEKAHQRLRIRNLP